jgi:elongation factor Ts
MTITTEQIKQLRTETGAGVLDCRKALEQTEGDLARAIAILREKGLAKAAKRADRETSEGVLELYTHGKGRVGVMVEVNSESDFVARSDAFRKFAHEVALQIAASAPQYIRVEDIPAEVLAQETEKAAQSALEESQPAEMVEKFVESRLEKFKKEACLLKQPYIRDESINIENMLHSAIGALGENIIIRRFVRWEVGESTAQ